VKLPYAHGSRRVLGSIDQNIYIIDQKNMLSDQSKKKNF